MKYSRFVCGRFKEKDMGKERILNPSVQDQEKQKHDQFKVSSWCLDRFRRSTVKEYGQFRTQTKRGKKR